jgi:hypothetical protein
VRAVRGEDDRAIEIGEDTGVLVLQVPPRVTSGQAARASDANFCLMWSGYSPTWVWTSVITASSSTIVVGPPRVPISRGRRALSV